MARLAKIKDFGGPPIFMNRFFYIILAFLFVPGTVCAAQGAESRPAGQIKLIVTGFKNDTGLLKVALADSPESYRARKGELPAPLRAATVEISGQKAECVFEDIPYGEYAVKMFHDENGNGELDANFLGIPSEPYGFSNNARALGLPAYERVKFLLGSDEVTLNIEIK
jgi:uncharacterized protein (DUF2141 family)